LHRRAPHLPIEIYPTPVQGEGAGEKIAAAITLAGQSSCDAIILCRGGGSIEDLWAFNDEAVARAIRASKIPVVSGVGHETDFTIADFAADLRAPTPTAAAELLSPDREALLNRLSQLNRQMRQQTGRSLAERGQQIDWLASRLTHPAQHLQQQRESLRHQVFRLTNAARWQISAPKMKLNGLSASLSQLDPLAVLTRGYAIAIGPGGKAVRDAGTLSIGSELRLNFARGSALGTVNQVVATPEAD
jgi:exodeoxyribonuclease VII large subunit